MNRNLILLWPSMVWSLAIFFDTVQPSLLHNSDSGPRMNRLEEIYTLLATKDASLRGFKVVNDLTCVFNSSFIRYMLHHDRAM